MFVSQVCQRPIALMAKPVFSKVSKQRLPNSAMITRLTHTEKNHVALATQEQLHKVQLGLNDKIAGLETKLIEKIAGVETRLTEKFTKEIAGVETRLTEKFTKEIAGVETRLTEKFTKEIAGVETRLTEKISKSHTELSEKIVTGQAQLLTAIEKQNTGNERFKKRIYTLFGGLAATFMAYANSERLIARFASLKP